jgi:hypothetical protein
LSELRLSKVMKSTDQDGVVRPEINPLTFAVESTTNDRLEADRIRISFKCRTRWSQWSPAALQPWSLLCLRRNPPSLLRRSSFSYKGWKRVLLRQGFGGHSLRIPPQLYSCGFLRRRVNDQKERTRPSLSGPRTSPSLNHNGRVTDRAWAG